MGKINWTALICAIAGICLGALFMGIYADSIRREKQMVETQRDVLSDIIRAHHDEQTCGGDQRYLDDIYCIAQQMLPLVNCDTTNLMDWGYCY